MSGWNGERIGRLSLRLDVAYCAVLGFGVAIMAPRIAEVLPLPVVVIAAIGAAVVVWAGVVVLMLARLPLRTALRIVCAANLVAAIAVAAVSTIGAALLVVLSVLAIAVDIALFAGSQVLALRRIAV